MKRKPAEAEAAIVPKEILEQAKLASETDKAVDRPATVAKCQVCGDPCASIANEGLCWVCRRLKISAWKDSDVQMGAQE